MDEVNTIVEKLRRRYPYLESHAKEDICYATTNRQDAIKTLLKSVDLLIAVGSQNSSNSRRLLEKGLAEGVPGYLVDGPEDLQLEWSVDVETVVMTVGASAPESAVAECVHYLKQQFNAEFSDAVLREESMRFPLPRQLEILRGLGSSDNQLVE